MLRVPMWYHESDEGTRACGHNTSRRVEMGVTTSPTGHYHGRTALLDNNDDGRGSQHLAQKLTYRRLIFQNSPSSESAFHGLLNGLKAKLFFVNSPTLHLIRSFASLRWCDFISSATAQVGLESAR